ncbi:transposase family protein [Dactylosporangium aurantiacum]|uniref:transposase family protein n=1 Tax=Dactylosporangium aurantiacum TaxID=35754 RepID=UPI0012DBEE34|nr:transposase family protein [Dactylosporangium aurantiacum]MDG6107201.1 transposase family protein [Dactylosporangium aurantiacum]
MLARTQPTQVGCPTCAESTGRVHAYHRRRFAALPVAGRGVVVEVRVRRLRCLTVDCPQQTFREQVPELTTRWARRTRQLTALVGDLAVAAAGSSGQVCSAVTGCLRA